MNLDVLIIDATTPKPYNWETLERESLGGTESSVVRLSEGFGSKGLKVAVMQPYEFVAHESPNKVQYLPLSWASILKPKNVICLRAKPKFEMYPDAKFFVWFHDLAENGDYAVYTQDMIKYNATGVAVSDWHTTNILQAAPGMPLVRIYSPVDESCYSYPPVEKVDPFQLVWMSSPHKGLDKALDVFKELQEKDSRFKLIVFNPGYWYETQRPSRNVIYLPKATRKVMRSVVAHSLCLFYPTDFQETFGLVAAEANCLRVPVATYSVAALQESVGNEFCTSKEDLLNKIYSWSQGNRPPVLGQDRFKFEEVYKDWVEVLKT